MKKWMVWSLEEKQNTLPSMWVQCWLHSHPWQTQLAVCKSHLASSSSSGYHPLERSFRSWYMQQTHKSPSCRKEQHVHRAPNLQTSTSQLEASEAGVHGTLGTARWLCSADRLGSTKSSLAFLYSRCVAWGKTGQHGHCLRQNAQGIRRLRPSLLWEWKFRKVIKIHKSSVGLKEKKKWKTAQVSQNRSKRWSWSQDNVLLLPWG